MLDFFGVEKPWYLLVVVCAGMVFSFGPNAHGAARMKKTSEVDSHFTNSCDAHGSAVVPKPPLIAKYEAAIKAEMVRYYKAHSSYAKPIDVDRLCIQIEEFTWKNASYRLSVSFRHIPTFLPYNSNYVQAHLMLMTTSGHMVSSEPIYSSAHPKPGAAEDTIPRDRTGFFPGITYFTDELNFVDQALRKAQVVYRYEEGEPRTRSLSIDVSRGLEDLKAFKASIMEYEEHYTILHEVEDTRYAFVQPYDGFTNQPLGFDSSHMVLLYDIAKADGRISNIRYRKYPPPLLI